LRSEPTATSSSTFRAKVGFEHELSRMPNYALERSLVGIRMELSA
jgi:hypothetical protein